MKTLNITFNLNDQTVQPLNFNILVDQLASSCSQLNTLHIERGRISETFAEVINACNERLPFLKSLVFRSSRFLGLGQNDIYGDSKISSLELANCEFGGHVPSPDFDRFLNLKKLSLYGSFDCILWLPDVQSVIPGLSVLNLGFLATTHTFQAIKELGRNLTYLFLCMVALEDDDLTFDPSTFPHLTTVCLRCNLKLTERGIVALSHSCPSLVKICVEDDLADSIVTNIHISTTLRLIGPCFLHCS